MTGSWEARYAAEFFGTLIQDSPMEDGSWLHRDMDWGSCSQP